jgi:hypothetical protein
MLAQREAELYIHTRETLGSMNLPYPHGEANSVLTKYGVEVALQVGCLLLEYDGRFLEAVKKWTSEPWGSCVYAS